jgi:diacylglycerol kinase (ATP)
MTQGDSKNRIEHLPAVLEPERTDLMVNAGFRTTLIINPNAGSTGENTVEQLEAGLRELGYDCEHRHTETPDDLETVLSDPGDLVVAAGGDGTLRAVAMQLAGRGIPLAVVPMGTANNIGLSVGVTGSVESWLEGFKQPRKVPFDVGVVRGSWGRELFLEGAGVGLFANGLANYDPDIGKNVLRAIGATVQTWREFTPKAFRVWVEGEPLEEPLMMLEVMNTPSIGPRLRLAPEANPGDGLLDVVMVSADQQVGFTSYLANLVQGRFTDLPNVTHRRVRQVAFEWDGSPLHTDDLLHQTETTERLEIEVWPAALELWLPASETSTNASSAAL